jgi:hypothetical protein
MSKERTFRENEVRVCALLRDATAVTGSRLDDCGTYVGFQGNRLAQSEALRFRLMQERRASLCASLGLFDGLGFSSSYGPQTVIAHIIEGH